MPSCEKCWADSRLAEMRGVECAYTKLVDARTARGEVCTPEEQAGPDATRCERCDRMTRHQHCRICMNCGAGAPKEES
jgi:hypothetical protein